MAMRAPEAGSDTEPQAATPAVPDDHPVLLAMLNAPLAAEPMTDDEIQALEELRRMKRSRGA
jgi:hypothetical protein